MWVGPDHSRPSLSPANRNPDEIPDGRVNAKSNASSGHQGPPTIASTPPAATIPEDLTFGGSVQGHATAGLSPHPHADSDPRGGDHNAFTEWTQCADFSYDFNGGHTAHAWRPSGEMIGSGGRSWGVMRAV